MKLNIALAGVLVAGFILPAVAQTTTIEKVPADAQATTFYVVQDSATKKCQIMDAKPTATEMTVIGGDGSVYKTRTEAEGAMESVKVCSTN